MNTLTSDELATVSGGNLAPGGMTPTDLGKATAETMSWLGRVAEYRAAAEMLAFLQRYAA